MTDAQVDDLLWRALEPLLPARRRRPKGGHPFADDRACLLGILFVLRTERPWREVPPAPGVSGVTCWRRLRDGQAAGVWAALHEAALAKLGRSGGLDWSRASLDSSSVRAERGATRSAPAPRTEGEAAPSSTGSSTDSGRRSPSCSRARTATSASSWPPCSTPCAPSKARGGVPAAAPPSATPTRPTTMRPAAARAASAGSSTASPAEARTPPPSWATTAGSWSAPSRGCDPCAAWASDGRGRPTTGSPSRSSAAPSCACAGSSGTSGCETTS